MAEEEAAPGRVPRNHPDVVPLVSRSDGHEFGKPRNPQNYRPSLVDWFLTKTARTLISQNRCRFKYQGLDLDLAYITDRIIAMGYPSESLEGAIRNTMKETVEFLKRRHSIERVKVFNLRGNFFYSPKNFADNVITFDMTDHHPPKLELMAPFCREALFWLLDHPENVIAVHCKAGKGRTGVMICALLCYIQFYPSARQIIDYYSIIRTKNNKGVTIPSQRRYIYYFAKLRELNLNYFPIRMQLIGIYLECPPQTHTHKTAIKIRVANMSSMVYDPPVLELNQEKMRVEAQFWHGNHGGFRECEAEQAYDPKSCKNEGKIVARRAYSFLVPEGREVFVEGDVRVDMLAERDAIGCGPVTVNYEKIGHVWFNTMFACSGALIPVDNPQPNDPARFFEYNDKAEPYPDGETSIAVRDLGDRSEFEYIEGAGRTRPDIGDLKILEPPHINRIANPSVLDRMYAKYGMENPRLENARAIHKSHAQGKVVDDYNIRRKKAERGKSPVHVARDMPDRHREVDGPFCIRAKKGEHVLTFPVYEMDRALKSKTINDNMKIHVVLKCIDGSNQEMVDKSEVFTNTNFAKSVARANTQDAGRRGFPYRFPRPGSYGAERQFPQAVRYSDKNGQYNGEPSFPIPHRIDPRSNVERWNRFFYRPRPGSPSRYRGPKHYCEAGEVYFEPKNTNGDDPNGPGDDELPNIASGSASPSFNPADIVYTPVVTRPSSTTEQNSTASTSTAQNPQASDTTPSVPPPAEAASSESAAAEPQNEDQLNRTKIVKYKGKKDFRLADNQKMFFEKFRHNLPDDVEDDPNVLYQESDEYKRLVITSLDYNSLPKSTRTKLEEFRSSDNPYEPGHDLRYEHRYDRFKCEVEEDFEQKNYEDDGSDYLTEEMIEEKKKQDEKDKKSREDDAEAFKNKVFFAERREMYDKNDKATKDAWKVFSQKEKERLSKQCRTGDLTTRSPAAEKLGSYFKSWKLQRLKKFF